MFMFSLGVIVCITAFISFVVCWINKDFPKWAGIVLGTILFFFGVISIFTSTAIYVKDNQGGIVIRKFGPDLPPNRIIAINGEKGPQAKVLPPGWHFGYLPFLYSLESVDNHVVSQGQVGLVLAKDGKSLPEGDVFAEEWSSPENMLDATKFLTEKGYRGPQLTVLPPGQYRYNPRLYQIKNKKALEVPVGKVAVIKANAGPKYEGKDVFSVNGVPIVPNKYRGIWKNALTPNAYYIHPDAYIVMFVKTTNRIYSYTSPSNLSKGNLSDKNNSISVRTKDGYEFPVDIRASIKITAENAPFVVAMLANPDADLDKDGFDILEEIVILPSIRAIFRNSAESRGALEYVNSRSQIEKAATEAFGQGLKKFKIETDGVFVADIGLSKTLEGKELLKTQTDKEKAIQERTTWAEVEKAQLARANAVKAQEQADQEKNKAAAAAQIEIAKSEAQARIERANGEAFAYKTKVEALGGVENFVKLELMQKFLDKWQGQVPTVLTSGGSSEALMGSILKDATK